MLLTSVVYARCRVNSRTGEKIRKVVFKVNIIMSLALFTILCYPTGYTSPKWA